MRISGAKKEDEFPAVYDVLPGLSLRVEFQQSNPSLNCLVILLLAMYNCGFQFFGLDGLIPYNKGNGKEEKVENH
jgi:hypothetical protein